MRIRAKKATSLLLALVMVFSLVQIPVFADEATPTASLNYNSSTGYYDLVITGKTQGANEKLYYRNGGVVSEWVANTASFTTNGFAAKYSATVPTVADSDWLPVNVDVTVDNAGVKVALDKYDTNASITDLSGFSASVDSVDTNVINNTAQKAFVKSTVEGRYKNVNAAYKTLASVSNSVATMTTSSHFSNAYTQIANAVSSANGASASTFKTAVMNYGSRVRSAVDQKKLDMGITSGVESNVKSIFSHFYSRGVAYSVKNVVIDSNNAQIKLIFDTSAGVSSVKAGDMENWLYNEVLTYILSVDNGFTGKVITVDIEMPTNSGVTSMTFKYAANYNQKFDKELMDDLTDEISTSFEYLTFDHKLAYVGNSDYSVSNDYDIDAPTIVVVADGDFPRSDSDWRDKDTLEFIDWYTYDVAEPIINKTGLNVLILMYDENEVLLQKQYITASSLGGGSSNSTFAKIQNMLNDDFDEWDELKFSYTVSGTTKTINVNMKGTNFRERYELWQNIDRSEFDNWVNKAIVLAVMSYQDSDIRVKLYDKNDLLIDTYELEYDDVSVDREEVEDYLNDNNYSWNGLYWDFKLTMEDDGTHVVAKGDFRSNDSIWKNITTTEVKEWAKEIATYVIEAIPRNLTITFTDQYGSTLRSYTYLRAGFTDCRVFEDALNEKMLSYDGFNFTAEVNYGTSRISVNLSSDDFDRNDKAYTSIRNDKSFKSWIEEAVAGPTVAEFDKDVGVYIYDEDGDQCGSFSWSKSFASKGVASTNINDMVNALNKYLTIVDPSQSSSNKVSATHSATYDSRNEVVKIKTRLNVSSKSAQWTDRDTWQYNRFISLIMARASWTKKEVELTVLDKSSNTIGTYSSTQYNQEDYENGIKSYDGGRYDPYGGYIYLSKELYEREPNKLDINEQVIEYLKDLNGRFTSYKLVLPVTDGSAVSLHISKNAAGFMRNYGFQIILDGTGIATTIKGTGMSNREQTITLTPSSLGTTDNGVYMTAKYTLTADYNINVSVANMARKGKVYKYQNNKWTSMNNTSSSNVKELVFGIGVDVVNFNDISSSNYQESIRKVAAYGLMEGVGNGMFNPSSVLTRAEATQMVVNGIAPSSTPSGNFVDVQRDAWYYDAVMKASNLGIVNGVGNNMFLPNATLTYDEFLTILYRTGDTLKLNKNSGSDTIYVDCADWAKVYVAHMVNLGVVNSYSYTGSAEVTRDAAADMMCKYLVAIGYII